MKEAMFASGLGGPFASSESTPIADRGTSTGVRASRSIGSHTGISLTFAHTEFGGIRGGDDHGNDILVVPDVRTVAPLGEVNIWRVRVGAGPALQFVRARCTGTSDDGHYPDVRDLRIGGMAHSTLSVTSLRQPVFLELSAQYHYVGPAELGPYQMPTPDPFFGGDPLTIPASSAHFDHFVFALGFGIRW